MKHIIIFLSILCISFFFLHHMLPREQIMLKKEKIPASLYFQEKPLSWEQEQSDIKANPEASFGILKNGIRYLILPNSRPENRASFHLYVRSGALMEKESQRGLSHFLEHLLFNGTRNYPVGTLVPSLQKLGMDFGSHINGTTYFDRTLYKLEIPDTSQKLIDIAFNVLHDYADGALLEEKEIKQERGVILAEKNSSDSINRRLIKSFFSTLFPDAIISERMPIGIEKVIRKAPRSEFLNLYQEYYIPARMTIVVVGDIDPAKIKKDIERKFSSIKQAQKEGKAPDLGFITTYQEPYFSVIREKEVPQTQINFYQIEIQKQAIDNLATRRKAFIEKSISSIFHQRFNELAEEKNAPITQGWQSSETLFHHINLGEIGISVANNKWQEALSLIEKEIRSRLIYGFTEEELKYAKANILNAYQNRAKEAGTLRSSKVAKKILYQLSKGKIITHPEEDFRIAQEILETITTKDLKKAFKRWQKENIHIVVTTASRWISPKQIKKTYAQSGKNEISPPAKQKSIHFGYSPKPTEGKIKKKEYLKAQDITIATFANNAVVNMKPSSFQKNQILFELRVGKGILEKGEKQASHLKMLAENAFIRGALLKHSWQEIQKLSAGHSIDLQFQIENDAFVFRGTTTPKDLEFQLSLLSAYLMEAGYREEAELIYQKQVPEIYRELKSTTSGAKEKFQHWLQGKDSRFIPPSQKEAKKANFNRLKKWLNPALQKGSIELNLVGDFTLENSLKSIAKTFGTLPTRKPITPLSSEETKLPEIDLKNKKPHQFTYQSKIDKDITIAGWKLPPLDLEDMKTTRSINMLANIFSERMRVEIRETLGIAYSPYALVKNSQIFPSFNYLLAFNKEKKKHSKKIHQVLRKIAQDLAHQGTNKDELQRVLKPIMEGIERSSKTNEYWIYVLGNSTQFPQQIKWTETRAKDYSSINVQELNELAKEILKNQNYFSATLTSK